MDYISINGNMQSQYMFSNAELMRQSYQKISNISQPLQARQFISNKTDWTNYKLGVLNDFLFQVKALTVP